MKPTVLILISHYIPGYKIGGPLTSIKNIVDNLSDKFDFEIITWDRDMGDSKPYQNICANKWINKDNYRIYYLSKKLVSAIKIIRIINSSNANIIYLTSFFSPFFSIYIVLLNRLKIINGKRIIIATKGEMYVEALNFKSIKKNMYLFLSKKINLYSNIFFHASTVFEKEGIIKSQNIAPDKIRIAKNLPGNSNKYHFQKKIISSNLTANKLNIIFLSRISKDKNLPFVFDVLSKSNASILLSIYGPIEDNYIWKQCIDKAKFLPPNIQYEYNGIASREDVKDLICQYDLLFLPTFAENFGHVISESLSVGTPVLISDNTPWRGLTEVGLGWDISLGFPEKFAEIINTIAIEKQSGIIKDRRKIIQSYNLKLDTQKTINDHINLFSFDTVLDTLK